MFVHFLMGSLHGSIDILTKVSQCNQKRLAVYHPSAYLNGHWLCCRASSDTAAGCSPCTR